MTTFNHDNCSRILLIDSMSSLCTQINWGVSRPSPVRSLALPVKAFWGSEINSCWIETILLSPCKTHTQIYLANLQRSIQYRKPGRRIWKRQKQKESKTCINNPHSPTVLRRFFCKRPAGVRLPFLEPFFPPFPTPFPAWPWTEFPSEGILVLPRPMGSMTRKNTEKTPNFDASSLPLSKKSQQSFSLETGMIGKNCNKWERLQ